MTDDQLTSNEPAATRWDGHNVITVSYDDDRSAYDALTLLKELTPNGASAWTRPSSSSATRTDA